MAGAPTAAVRYDVDRVVLFIRHGIRAPLAGEADFSGLAADPPPEWTTRPGDLTPHGAAALRLLGRYDRGRFAAQGLLPRHGCPAMGRLDVYANSMSRTIASGEAFAQGLAPGCAVEVRHRPEGRLDPLFDAVEAGAVPFDAAEAAADARRRFAGGSGLLDGQDAAFGAMARVLGCDRRALPCDLRGLGSGIEASGGGLRVTGAIDRTSGLAQVLLLQYAEGMPLPEVGWGRAGPAEIAAMSSLHGRAFEVHSRTAYMAPRVGGLLARRIVADLAASGRPAVSVLVGHDNTVAAVSELFGLRFHLPGYGRDDPPLGGGLLFERLRAVGSGRRFVRVFYEAQTPGQLRTLAPLDARHPPSLVPLRLRGCGIVCPLDRLATRLDRRLVPVRAAWRTEARD